MGCAWGLERPRQGAMAHAQKIGKFTSEAGLVELFANKLDLLLAVHGLGAEGTHRETR